MSFKGVLVLIINLPLSKTRGEHLQIERRAWSPSRSAELRSKVGEGAVPLRSLGCRRGAGCGTGTAWRADHCTLSCVFSLLQLRPVPEKSFPLAFCNWEVGDLTTYCP